MSEIDIFKSVVDGSVVNLTLPNNTTSIAEWAFYYCENLESIIIPDSVTSIGSEVFLGCSKLNNAIVGRNVSLINSRAFANTAGALYIKTITFNQPSGMSITLGTEIFKCKTASSLTVYTDNETIKNYDYSSDNVSPTFYHLDGSAWA